MGRSGQKLVDKENTQVVPDVDTLASLRSSLLERMKLEMDFLNMAVAFRPPGFVWADTLET